MKDGSTEPNRKQRNTKGSEQVAKKQSTCIRMSTSPDTAYALFCFARWHQSHNDAQPQLLWRCITKRSWNGAPFRPLRYPTFWEQKSRGTFLKAKLERTQSLRLCTSKGLVCWCLSAFHHLQVSAKQSNRKEKAKVKEENKPATEMKGKQNGHISSSHYG